MTPATRPPTSRAAGCLIAVLLAAVLGGCGPEDAVVTPKSPQEALHDAAQLSDKALDAQEKFMREVCPKAAVNGGRDMTEREAKACLRKARDRYFEMLRREGYDPARVVDDK